MHSGTNPHADVDADATFRHRESVAVAATELAWALALATTRTAVASTVQAFELWSQLLRAQAVPPPWSPFASPAGWLRSPAGSPWNASRAPCATASPSPVPEPHEPAAPMDSRPSTGAGEAAAETPTFASYRSSSGHAAAQISRRD